MGRVTCTRTRPRWGTRIAVLAAALIGAGGCSAVTPIIETPPAPTPTPTSTPRLIEPTKNAVQLVSQTDTEWGRIWDALPASFALPEGAQPTQTGDGPASAILDVPGGAAPTMAFLQSALELAGFRTESLSGPLEDGSLILETFAEDACRVQASVVPLGGATILTVLYGAACPFSQEAR
jgi:hypothetical protein